MDIITDNYFYPKPENKLEISAVRLLLLAILKCDGSL
jgi:hypothetical protein